MAGPKYVLVISCPNTGREIRTGMTAENRNDYLTWQLDSMSVVCPECGETHEWQPTDARPVLYKP